MKKVWFSLLAIGVLAFSIFGSTNNGKQIITAQGADDVPPTAFPIQPPV